MALSLERFVAYWQDDNQSWKSVDELMTAYSNIGKFAAWDKSHPDKSEGLTDEEKNEIANGRKIQAIKLIRSRLNLSLLEAKNMADVEALRQKLTGESFDQQRSGW